MKLFISLISLVVQLIIIPFALIGTLLFISVPFLRRKSARDYMSNRYGPDPSLWRDRIRDEYQEMSKGNDKESL